MSEDKLWEVRNWLCNNTAYSIDVKIVQLYGCSCFYGKYKGEDIFIENGKDVVKHVLSIFLKLKSHSLSIGFDNVSDSIWKPIDTAPQDGTRFLALEGFDSKDILFGYYDTCEGRYYDCFCGNAHLTHWAPLPLPPAGSP